MIQSKPMSSEERVVKYTEFAAEFGRHNNLDLSGKDLGFIQFYNLDIILPVIGGLTMLILCVVLRVFVILYKKIYVNYFDGKQKNE